MSRQGDKLNINNEGSPNVEKKATSPVEGYVIPLDDNDNDTGIYSGSETEQIREDEAEIDEILRIRWLEGLSKLRELDYNFFNAQSPKKDNPVVKKQLQESINLLYPIALSVAQNIRNPEEFNQLLDFAEITIKVGRGDGLGNDLAETVNAGQTTTRKSGSSGGTKQTKAAQPPEQVVVGIQELRKEIEKFASRFAGEQTAAGLFSLADNQAGTTFQEDSNLTVMGSLIYQAVREALSKNTFQKLEGTPWPTALLQKGNSRGQAQLRPPVIEDQPLLSPQEVEKWSLIMWKQREELSDLDADALDLLSHTWLTQVRGPGQYAIADVDQFLTLRGLKPKQGGEGRRGGYEPEQRAEMLQALSHIQNLWLNMGEVEMFEEKGKSGRKQRVVKQNVQSKAFVITDRMGQMSMEGYMDVRRFIFQPGHLFSHYLFGPGRQTALLSAKAVQYDPYRQKWEKRLARYLSWQWRNQARRGEYLRPYRVITLLEAVGEEINQRYPSKTRERLEKALDMLQKDEVISGWQYDRWDENVMEKRGWGDIWKESTILIEPPEIIRETYRPIEQKQTGNSRQLVSGGSSNSKLNSRYTPAQSQASINFDGVDTNKKDEVGEAATRGSRAFGKGSTQAANYRESEPTLGERIRQYRKQYKLSQLQAAEQLEIGQSYFSKLERDQMEPSPDIKKRILKWLGSSPA